MTQREVGLVLVGALAAGIVSLFLFVAVLARQGSGRPSVALGRQPVPTAQPIAVVERRIPQEFRALLAPLLPIERGVADAGRDAATLLLILLATGGALVLGRDQVLRIRASTAGDPVEQLRIFGIGVALLVAIVCALFLAVFVLLRGVIALTPQTIPIGLQVILSSLSLVGLGVGLVALLGFTATASRVGSWLLGLRPWRRFGERVPAAVATLGAVVLIFLLSQVPIVGRLEAAVILAYSLGAFVRARLVQTQARAA
jgi:hypothetical protein